MVKVGCETSTWREVLSGIPQGSCLGPLLFMIYIRDMGSNIPKEEGLVYKFVDDSKLILGVRNHEDMVHFQESTNKMYRWQEANNMSFNALKFQLLRFGNNIELKKAQSLRLWMAPTFNPLKVSEI